MKKGKLISIVFVSAFVVMLSATSALAGNNSDMSKEKGVPQQIRDLLNEVGTLQKNVQSQSNQISGLSNQLTTDEQTISKLQSTVSKQEGAINLTTTTKSMLHPLKKKLIN